MAGFGHRVAARSRPYFCTMMLAIMPFAFSSTALSDEPIGDLEIHYINIGQGGSTLIIGPDGTTILYDFGNVGRGGAIVDYLKDSVQITPSDGLDFTIVSHMDKDHYGGYVDVIKAGYNVRVANFYSGSDKHVTNNMDKVWLKPAREKTSAGDIVQLPVGLKIPLGDGAEARVIAANGKVFSVDKDTLPFARNENDRSISLYIKYRNFDFILDGDLGAGKETCTDHDTSQKDIQKPVAEALLKLGWMSQANGVDVLHIAHHGSESSTSAKYFNLVKPEVGLISVGKNQSNFRHPREDVVDKVLVGDDRANCVNEAELQELFQTEEGVAGSSSTGATSFSGTVIGDIKLITDGKKTYRISGSGRVTEGEVESNPANGFWCIPLDEIDISVSNPCDDVEPNG